MSALRSIGDDSLRPESRHSRHGRMYDSGRARSGRRKSLWQWPTKLYHQGTTHPRDLPWPRNPRRSPPPKLSPPPRRKPLPRSPRRRSNRFHHRRLCSHALRPAVRLARHLAISPLWVGSRHWLPAGRWTFGGWRADGGLHSLRDAKTTRRRCVGWSASIPCTRP